MDHDQKSYEYGQKLNFYWPVLIIAVLAISIESSSFNKLVLVAVLEISSWVFFIVSLIIALHRIEKISVLHGVRSSIENEPDKNSAEAEKFSVSQNVLLERLYIAQKWLFVFGIIFLVVSRAYIQLVGNFPECFA